MKGFFYDLASDNFATFRVKLIPMTKEYSNGEVTIVWKPEMCIHSAICARGLPGVFQPREKPWVKEQGASTQEIIRQIQKCPSGALSYYMNHQKHNNG